MGNLKVKKSTECLLYTKTYKMSNYNTCCNIVRVKQLSWFRFFKSYS